MRVQAFDTWDGDIYDEAWEQAPWTRPFVDIEGKLKPFEIKDFIKTDK